MIVLTEEEIKTILEAADNEDSKKASEALAPFQDKINLPDHLGDTLLIRAVKQKKTNALKSLIAAKADVNAKGEYGKTPLHWAATQGDVLGIKILFANGANLEGRTDERYTALHFAVQQKQLPATLTLIELKADVNDQINIMFETPMHKAAKVNFSPAGIRHLFNARANINTRNRFDSTPLHNAAASNQLDAMQTLIELKADVTVKNKYNKTPFKTAITERRSSAVLFLLEKGIHQEFKEFVDDNGDYQEFKEMDDNNAFKLWVFHRDVQPCATPQYLQFTADVIKLQFHKIQKDLFLSKRNALYNFSRKHFNKIQRPFFSVHAEKLDSARAKISATFSRKQARSILSFAISNYMVVTHLKPIEPNEFMQSALTALKAALEIIKANLPELPRQLQELCAAYAGLPAERIPTVLSEEAQTQIMQGILGQDWDQKTSLEEMLTDVHQELLKTHLNTVHHIPFDGGADLRTNPHMLTALQMVVKDQPSLKEVAKMPVGSSSANAAASNAAASINVATSNKR